MYESPPSLESLCLDSICANILHYVYPLEPQRFAFHDPDLFLIRELSEKLITRLADRGQLRDPLMHLFNSHNTHLSTVRLKNAPITRTAFAVLKQHKINDLECTNLKDISIGDMLDCLCDWSVHNMTAVNFARCTFIDIQRHCLMVKVTNFKNIKALNLAYTQLNQNSFQMICEDLRFLEKFDISGTCVKDLSPLTHLIGQLTSLAISDLSQAKNYVRTMVQLRNLRHLDVSVFNEKLDDSSDDDICPVLDLLQYYSNLPLLVSLDVCGWRDFIPAEVLLKFLHYHPKLGFLGLVLNDANSDPEFREDFDGITIAGLSTEHQIMVTLQKYPNRTKYVQKGLYHLFQMTNIPKQTSPEMFKLVIPVMGAHYSEFGVQMAATACLYNLTKGELSKKIHPRLLTEAVHLTLQAMERFPKQFQLQKNSLLTLCSDTILQEINFDRFRCVKLVLDTVCNFQDGNMNRMAVAICSILAAKVSTEETSELGAQPCYMRKLLLMVQSRVESEISDITLKFTLSALWNLTDESAATCTVFLEQGGTQLFLIVLEKFRDESAIEAKVLGLLNNIAEVVHLRINLMLDSLMGELFYLLKSVNIDVSYFAAGIVAHLASDGPDTWTVGCHGRDEMLEELQKAVMRWTVPESEMVAYRSFRPFFPLLKIEMDCNVQLWAVWAIQHVCIKNPKRYCLMLQEEKGDLFLNDLINFRASHPQVRLISSKILEMIAINL